MTVDAAAFDDLLRRAEVGRETIFDLLAEGDESVRRIEITHQNIAAPLLRDQPEPSIARAGARNHVFNSIATLAAYIRRAQEVNGNDTMETTALADIAKREIVVVLDEFLTEDRETLTYKPIIHPLFAPWQAMAGRTVGAMDFARFIMENRRAITKADGREMAMIFQQLRMSQSIKMSQGVGKRALNGVMVETVIQGQRAEEFIELPEEVSIYIPIYCDSGDDLITFDLTVSGDEDGCTVTMTASDLEKKRYDAFEAMVKQLSEETDIICGLGSIQTRSWNTVRQV